MDSVVPCLDAEVLAMELRFFPFEDNERSEDLSEESERSIRRA